MELSEKAKRVYDSWVGATIVSDENGWDIVGKAHFDTLEELNDYLEKIFDVLNMA